MTDITGNVQNTVEVAKDMSNAVANEGAQLFGKASDTMSNMASSSMNAVSNNVAYAQDMANTYLNNLSTVFWAAIVLLIVCFLIGWGLYVLIADNVTKQQRILVGGTEAPIICNEASDYKLSYTLDSSNGNRCSYAFWIYINDITKYQGDNFRHVAHIGESHATITKASPYIFLHGSTNTLYIRFAPLDSTKDVLGSKKLNGSSLADLEKYDSDKYCTFTIDYVPIQRWVHICISINDTNSGIVYIYVDAELAKVNENKKSSFQMDVSKLNTIFSGNGKLYVGGDINDYQTGVTGFSGLISKFTMYNHDLNQNDVYKEYNTGPFSGLLTKIGLGTYGIRNPIYKINSASDK